MTWPRVEAQTDGIYGARPLFDGGRVRAPELAIARAILHTNLQIQPESALHFAVETARVARRHDLPPEFLAAVLLQESAYDPRALSSAGAVGIGQFTLDTASDAGVDPFDPDDSIAGSAALLGGYVADYRGRYADPYAVALAAYNAGPGAVAQSRGVPPYDETHAYIADIADRQARLYSYEK
ncbi:MAG: lytic transglycosylase domain-containing protein [Candidatus Eremiobacteraeota bacterium]|nr:lytic transglycosylase domain-containing protein [Candidatus Eremiobacteraeota bacterium]